MPIKSESIPKLTRTGSGRGYKYDYEQMFDGSTWLYEDGVDFDCTRRSFREAVRKEARKRQLNITTRKADEGIYIKRN